MKLHSLLLNPPPERLQAILLLLLRLLFGWLLLQTGLGKLQHLDQTAEFFGALGLPLPQLTAAVIGTIECAGGVLFAAGLFTRPTALVLSGTLAGALGTAHRAELLEGLDALVATTPFPYLLALAVVLVFGPGLISLDYRIWGKAS